MSPSLPATARERDEILRALASGRVPRLGLSHIQVGRAAEVQVLLEDMERIIAGGSALRLVIGPHGAGKTFLLTLARLAALERGCVTLHADLSPKHRLHGAGGQARSLYARAVRNMATRTRPEGGALAGVVERFIGACAGEAEARGTAVEPVIGERLASLHGPGDHTGVVEDHGAVLEAYWRASTDGDEVLKTAALRWLGGACCTQTEARQSLGVRTLVDDAGIQDALTRLAAFVRLAGYGGLFVAFDEMACLSGLEDPQAPGQILRIFDVSPEGDGGAPGLGIVLGGTPEVLDDVARGLASAPALRDALSEEESFGDAGPPGPLLRIAHLGQDELLALLANIRDVFTRGADEKRFPDAALKTFAEHCRRRLGAAWFSTPRSPIRAFVHLLGALEHSPGARWQDLLPTLPVVVDGQEPEDGPAEDDVAAAFVAEGKAGEITRPQP